MYRHLWSQYELPLNRPNLNETAEDDDFTAMTHKKKESKTKIRPMNTEATINTALPSSPTYGKMFPATHDQFITASQQIPPIIIHHYFEGDMKRISC
jgi:hypothetical protein